jgi:hypothetical protein
LDDRVYPRNGGVLTRRDPSSAEGMKPASSGEIPCGGVPSASPTLRQRAWSEPSVYQTVCDVAEFHDLDLSDQQIAANLPVLWSIAGEKGTHLWRVSGGAEGLGGPD